LAIKSHHVWPAEINPEETPWLSNPAAAIHRLQSLAKEKPNSAIDYKLATQADLIHR
jgi:hypothetical protein